MRNVEYEQSKPFHYKRASTGDVLLSKRVEHNTNFYFGSYPSLEIPAKLYRLQSNAIKGDNFQKIQNEIIIFPYKSIIERAINRENLRKFRNKFVPFNGVRL